MFAADLETPTTPPELTANPTNQNTPPLTTKYPMISMAAVKALPVSSEV